MVTLLLIVVLALTLAFAVAIPIALPRLSNSGYIAVCWIPAVALGLEWVFFEPLARLLSYGVILAPLLTCLASILLGIVGVTMLMRGSGGPRAVLVGATILASVPGLALLGYIVYAFSV